MPHSGLTRRNFTLFLLLLLFVAPSSPSLSQQLNITTVAESTHAEFLSISSDQEAASLFMKHFGQHLPIVSGPQQQSNKPHRVLISKEATHEVFHFMAHLITSIRAQRTQSFLQPMNVPMLDPLLNKETAPFHWIVSKLQSDTLSPVIDLANRYLQISQNREKWGNQPPDHFQVFADYFDHTYPQLLGSPTSWVAILEHGGAPAIQSRFNEFWETPRADPQNDEPKWEDYQQHQEDFAHYYLKTRLLPVFSSYLLARLIHTQAVSEHHARQSFIRLKQSIESNHHDPEVNRLCGTWHWTVHNHQNHRDHKMKLSFLPHTQQSGQHPQPDEIIIRGDTVYLKWEFQSGYQEDSLLLSNRDQRLEGTFRNSLGANGTISGKRLTTCPPD